jgi:hypothetical protein
MSRGKRAVDKSAFQCSAARLLLCVGGPREFSSLLRGGRDRLRLRRKRRRRESSELDAQRRDQESRRGVWQRYGNERREPGADLYGQNVLRHARRWRRGVVGRCRT